MTKHSKSSSALDSLVIKGARVHNLKNIDVEIPHGKLTVITGLSGSGKSSLAFDTIFAEGQRRYIETFSSYARQMLGTLERPDADQITGLSPVIAIEQKTINRNPRSTIGTTTEVYDFLRLLYARVGQARSYVSGKPMVKYSEEQIVELILKRFDGHKILLLSPLVKNRKGHYQELFEQLSHKGYLTVRVDGKMREISPGMKLDRYKNHSIELVVDKLKVTDVDIVRLRESVSSTLRQGGKQMILCDVDDDNSLHYFSRMLMDAEHGISYREPAPHNFSFNSPLGACERCKGLGEINIIDIDKVIPNRELSIAAGAIEPLGKLKSSMIFKQLEALLARHGFTLKTPVRNLSEEALNKVLYCCLLYRSRIRGDAH
ncbi:MAG: excinuclease ABC subunit UvrA, partial [Muribaculaceae bacterium]|nr:excinuclease ABC subunit UvrA [Muribaculaceae bacterium]